MASAIGKSRCVKCEKDKATSKCIGCAQDFCFNHLLAHREDLNQQLDHIECDRDQLRDAINKQTDLPQYHSLTEQIDRWELYSIEQIKRRANECRQMLLEQATGHFPAIEKRLAELTDELKHIRQENDFNEIDLTHAKQQITQITEQLKKPTNLTLQHPSTALITDISVLVSSGTSVSSNCVTNTTKWKQHGITIAGGNGEGNQLNQVFHPLAIHVDDDHKIYITDFDNHRIVQWNCETNKAQVVAGGNGAGNGMNQLNEPTDMVIDKKNDSIIICDKKNRRIVRWPRRNGTQGQTIITDMHCSRLAIDNDGNLYVSDSTKNEVRRWTIGETEGTVVAGGNGAGCQLNQFNKPTFIFVDDEHSVYVSDWGNNRVMKWMTGAEEGVVVAGGHDQGNSLTQLSHPQGVIVDDLGNVYVADCGNHRIMRWLKGSRQGSIVVGGNEQGQQSNQFSAPTDLSFDREGHLYVVDYTNHRIQKFDNDRTSTCSYDTMNSNE